MKAFIGLFALLVCGATALEFDRPCRDDVGVKENFNPAFYTGTWLELRNSVDKGAECVNHHYTRRGLQQVFDVERIGVVGGTYHREVSVVHVAFPDEPALRAIFNGTITRDDFTFDYNYRIIATDYTNYSLFWSCRELENNRSVEEGTVLSRRETLNDASLSKINAILEANGLDIDDFRPILHTPEACALLP